MFPLLNLSVWNHFLLIISCLIIVAANYVLLKSVQKFLPVFPDNTFNYKNTVERIYKNNFSLIFKSIFSINSSISELIYHGVLIFSLKIIFSKWYYFHYLLSLQHSERFLILLQLGLNCSKDKLLLPKSKISEPNSSSPKTITMS